jgi:hypothetical protein
MARDGCIKGDKCIKHYRSDLTKGPALMNALFGTVITIVLHTPLWVWPLYGLLLFLGFQRTRDSIIPLWRMLMLPIVVTLLAILSFILAGWSALPAVLLGLALGGFSGWHLERPGATRRMPDGRVWLRGEWWSFSLLLLILVYRYATSVIAGFNPALHSNLTWLLGTVFISTSLSALFLGRTAARLRVYFETTTAID